MARLGLGEGWRCLFANDIDAMKCAAYRANFGGGELAEADVWSLSAEDLPGRPDLAWASFPCQDLSLAGRRAGLNAARSGAFFGFWRLIEGLGAQGRLPPLLVLENVLGTLTSAGGADFAALCAHLADQGYRFGALALDAAWLLPQSRPRLYIIAARPPIPSAAVTAEDRQAPGLTAGIRNAYARLPAELQARWAWWRLPPPPLRRRAALADILEDDPPASAWLTATAATKLLAQMGPVHQTKLAQARAAGGPVVGALYRRTRAEAGARVVRAEARFDGLAGCLRTPAGGSSRQFVILVDGPHTRIRRLTPRESARLMGLPEDYILPKGATAALTLTGDGLAVPVVRWLAQGLLAPLLAARRRAPARAPSALA